MRLGVVIPMANEERTVHRFLSDVTDQLEVDDTVFCVIDRASTDGTRAIVDQLGECDGRVRLVWAPENRCVVDAYFKGYQAALDAGCDWILEMDAGFSHQPEEIPRFLDAMAEGFDYVGGCRFMIGGSHQGSWKRYLVSKGGTLLTNFLLSTRMRDMCSGFECFSRGALEMIVSKGVRSRAHFFQTEIRVMMHELRWCEVPITYRNPSPSLGGGSLKEALSNLWRLYRRPRETGGVRSIGSSSVYKESESHV